jgi:hypothetical protein
VVHTWRETSVAPSQVTLFLRIPRHRTLSYFLPTPCNNNNNNVKAQENNLYKQNTKERGAQKEKESSPNSQQRLE